MIRHRTIYCFFERGAKHAAMCRTAIQSIRAVDALNGIVVVTDEDGHEFTDATVLKIPAGLPIMLANIEAQITALMVLHNQYAAPTRVMFLDTDTLLLQPFTTEADLLVTWRDHVREIEGEKIEGIAGRMPYNYGVIVAKADRPAIEAFIWLRERVRKMHAGHKQWYGNQLALTELCGPRPSEGTAVDSRLIPWMLTEHGMAIEIEKVPCTHYNYTPMRVGENIEGKHVLHFKGASRGLMESYAKRLGISWSVAA
jgi:hypothetical protein